MQPNRIQVFIAKIFFCKFLMQHCILHPKCLPEFIVLTQNLYSHIGIGIGGTTNACKY